jgi:hypothetical protein
VNTVLEGAGYSGVPLPASQASASLFRHLRSIPLWLCRNTSTTCRELREVGRADL